MINLLPEGDKREIQAARSNLLLLRYNALLLLVSAFIALAIGFTYYALSSSQAGAIATIEENAKKEGGFTRIKSEATAFRSQLGEVKTVLDSQVSYSKAILEIAKLMPEGTALTALALDETSITRPLILSVKVSGKAQTEALRDNFTRSTLFTGVSPGKITINKSDVQYPYTIELTVTMKKEAIR